MIVACDLSAVGAGVNDFRVVWVGCNVATFASSDCVPIWTINRASCARTGDGHGCIVLLGAVDVIGKTVVGSDVVKLRRGLVVLAGPGVAVVGGNRGPTIVAVDETLRIRGIDPQRVIIPVRGAYRGEGFASVIGSVRRSVQDVYRIFRLGIGEDVRVVPCALPEAMVVSGDVPGVAAVVGAIDSAFLCFDDCPDPVGICAGDRDTDAAKNSFRQAVAFQFFPGRAAVNGAIKATSRATAVETPRSSPRLPQRREQDVGVAGIKHNVDAAGFGVLV